MSYSDSNRPVVFDEDSFISKINVLLASLEKTIQETEPKRWNVLPVLDSNSFFVTMFPGHQFFSSSALQIEKYCLCSI